MPRKPVAPVRKTGFPRLDLLAHRDDLRPHRVEAAVDVDDLGGDRAGGILSRNLIVSATGAGSSTSQRQRRLLLPGVGRSQKPGMPRAASVASGPRTRGSRARRAARGRARGSARWPPGRPWPRPSSHRPATRPARRSRARRSPRPPRGTVGQPDGQRLQRKRGRRERGAALSTGVLRKLPPSASRARRRSRAGCRRRGPSAPEVRGDGLDVLGLVDVELEDVRHRVQPRGGAVGHALRPAEPGQDDLRARRPGPAWRPRTRSTRG